MSQKLLFVLHPDQKENREKISDHVINLLEKHVDDARNKDYLVEQSERWIGSFNRSTYETFREFLLEQEFVEWTQNDIDRLKSEGRVAKALSVPDPTGIFVVCEETGLVKSVWEYQRPERYLELFQMENIKETKPLVMKTGQNVQSCLLGELDTERTPTPSTCLGLGLGLKYGDWLEAESNKLDCTDDDDEMSWSESFWKTISQCPPETRVTAVEFTERSENS